MLGESQEFFPYNKIRIIVNAVIEGCGSQENIDHGQKKGELLLHLHLETTPKCEEDTDEKYAGCLDGPQLAGGSFSSENQTPDRIIIGKAIRLSSPSASSSLRTRVETVSPRLISATVPARNTRISAR